MTDSPKFHRILWLIYGNENAAALFLRTTVDELSAKIFIWHKKQCCLNNYFLDLMKVDFFCQTNRKTDRLITMRNKVVFFLTAFCLSSLAYAHPLRKQLTINKTNVAPRIDAQPNDKAWEAAIEITDFIQQSPVNGGIPSQKTTVKMLYDDRAIYVLAFLYDSRPDSIFSELGDRDSGDQANADLFSVELNPYNNGLNSVEFMVSAAGVQMDSKNDLTEMHKSWDAVWKSAVVKNKSGWIAEMEIPFSAIRFPKKDIQVWEINFFRLIKRRGEAITWNFVDKNKNGWLNQAGEMLGLKDVHPPARLSLMPYMGTYYQQKKMAFKGGMDLKYGLNESFTLDMMLVPDFGQVQSDDQILNLTSVETKYDEKRQFFTEGTELFNKGNIFYSRRIGAQPRYYDRVGDRLSEHEVIRKNPTETYLYNATKISGRTASGWGLGLLNALTQRPQAELEDTLSGKVRRIATQEMTNYNMMVVDKVIGKESYVSLINSNVSSLNGVHMANVVGTDFMYKMSRYTISGDAFLSYIRDREEAGFANQTGHRLNLNFAKVKGAFRYQLNNTVYSNTYNPRDFGYLEVNNLISNVLKLQYFRFTPSRHFNDITGELNFTYENLYKPTSYARFEIDGNLKLLFRSLQSLTFYLSATPIKKYDYFEPRVEGWKYKEPTAGYAGIEYSSDFRKKLAFKSMVGYWQASRFHKNSIYFTFEPRFQINDRISIGYKANWSFLKNAIGFVDKTPENDSIFFGRRNIVNIENVVNTKLSFSNKSSLNLRLRHYWSNVKYSEYYLLQRSGDMGVAIMEKNYNNNVNLFNADLIYNWRFSPGSELSVVWKNGISAFNQVTGKNYFGNIKDLFACEQTNSISVKVIYYIDYPLLQCLFGHRKQVM